MWNWIKENKVAVFLASVLLIIGGIVIWRRSSRNVDFDFSFGNLSGLLGQLESHRSAGEKGLEFTISVPFTTTVKNDEDKTLKLDNAKIDLSYKGEKIMRTSGDGISETVPAKESKPIPSKIDVLVNSNTISFFKSVIKKEKPKLDYKVNTMVMGKPYTFDGTKIIQEEQQ